MREEESEQLFPTWMSLAGLKFMPRRNFLARGLLVRLLWILLKQALGQWRWTVSATHLDTNI